MIDGLNEQQLKELVAVHRSTAYRNQRAEMVRQRELLVKKLVSGNFGDNENDDIARGGIRAYDKILGLELKAENKLRKTLDGN